MPVRKSSFGEIPKPILMIGVVVFIIVIGVLAYLYKKNKPQPVAETSYVKYNLIGVINIVTTKS